MSSSSQSSSSPTARSFPICRHIKTNGHRCQAPALTGNSVCYFHRTLRRGHAGVRAACPKPPSTVPQQVGPLLLEPGLSNVLFTSLPTLNLPPLEDAESVQLAISLLFASIAAGQVEPYHARTLLYALQLASFNVRALPPPLAPPDPSRAGTPSRPNFFPDSDSAFDGPAATIVRRVVRTRSGETLAAPDDGNGTPSQADRPKSVLERLLEAIERDAAYQDPASPEATLNPQPPAPPQPQETSNPLPTPTV